MKWPWTREAAKTRTFDVGISTVSVFFERPLATGPIRFVHKVEFVGSVTVAYGYSYRHPFSYLRASYAQDLAAEFVNSNDPIEAKPGFFIPRSHVASYEVKLESLLIEKVIPQ